MRNPQTIIRILWRHKQKQTLSRRDLRILRAWLMASERNEELFDDLDAPVRRVAAKDVFVAYQPLLEDEILPQPEDIRKAMVELAAF